MTEAFWKRSPKRALAAVMAASLWGACTSESRDAAPTMTTSTTRAAAVAEVIGEFRMVGGPAPGIDQPLAGRIEARRETNDGEIVATTQSGEDGAFRIELPPGTYAFVGSTPRVVGPVCRAEARVNPGQNPPVKVVCLLR
jgi:hypothetical protein